MAPKQNDTQKAYDEQLSYQDIQKLCLEHSIPCNASPGQSWLFQQGHLHENHAIYVGNVLIAHIDYL